MEKIYISSVNILIIFYLFFEYFMQVDNVSWL